MLCSLNQDKLYNFVFSSFTGSSLQLQTCWIPVGTGSSRSAHTGTTLEEPDLAQL